jgi:large subunit ribosomal protein L22
MTQTVSAKLRYLRIAPRKVRRFANIIKGMPVERAMAELESRPGRPNPALLGLLRSAINNAINVHKLDRESLVVKNVRVDPGPALKRYLARAMGRATPILKRTSHVTITLEAKEGFKAQAPKTRIFTPSKAAKSEPEEAHPKEKGPKPPKKETPPKAMRRQGFMPRIFRRKAI